MNKNKAVIYNDTTPWEFIEKDEEDRNCVIKNKNSGHSYEGIIQSISSKGKYIVKVLKNVD